MAIKEKNMAQTINVDVTPSLFQPTLYYHQGDIGREFAINISTKDGYSIPSGATVKIEATKPSGFGFSVTGSISNNVVTFVSTEGMTDEFGRFPAQLEITSGNTVIYTANFLMVGEKNTHPDSTVDGSQEDVIPQLTLLVERVENAAAAVLDTTTEVTTLPAGSQATYSFDEETNTATFGIPQGEAGAGSAGVVASAYSASKTYAVGDYVIHNSNLYRCTTAIATAESFTASHWTQVVLADDVTDLKSESNNQQDNISFALKSLNPFINSESNVTLEAIGTQVWWVIGSGMVSQDGWQIFSGSIKPNTLYHIKADNYNGDAENVMFLRGNNQEIQAFHTASDLYFVTPSGVDTILINRSWRYSAEPVLYECETSRQTFNVIDSFDDLGLADYFDESTLTSGFIHNGVITSNEDYKVTDYIPCEYGDKVFCAIVNSTSLDSFDIFDADKVFITGYMPTEQGQVAREFTITHRNAKYLRYNVMPSNVLDYSKQYLKIMHMIDYPQDADLVEYKYITDLLTIGNSKTGYVVDRDGTEATSQYVTEWAVTDYIEIENGSYIEWASGQTDTGGGVPAICLYDASKSFIKGLYSDTQFGSGTARVEEPNAKYLRYNIVPNGYTPYTAQYLRTFVKRNQSILDDVGELQTELGKTITVSKLGTGDFTTFKEASEYCWTHPNTTVLIKDGTYDLVQEYGDTYLNNVSGYTYDHGIGAECGNDCKYIFSGGSKLVFDYTGANTNVSWAFSPINIVGNCEFENLTIECSNCRYCVHEDTPTVVQTPPRNMRVVYNNCHLKHKGNTLGDYRDTGCIGGGCSPYSESVINGGTFEGVNGFAISYHLPSYEENALCEVQINGAYCDGALRTSDYPTDKQGKLLFYANNCSLSEAVSLASKTESVLWNNTVR